MITTFLLGALAILLAFVVWQMMRPSQKKPEAAAPVTPLPSATPGSGVELKNARPGDVVSIQAGTADFSDLDFTVDRRSAYQTGPRRWTDLSGEFRGERVYLEVEGGPTPQITGILDPRRITLPELQVTEEKLAAWDTKQDPTEAFTFEGKRWQFVSSRELGYYENEAGEGEGLYRWVFAELGGDRQLVIEKWEGEPFDVRIARQLNAQDITVYRAA